MTQYRQQWRILVPRHKSWGSPRYVVTEIGCFERPRAASARLPVHTFEATHTFGAPVANAKDDVYRLLLQTSVYEDG